MPVECAIVSGRDGMGRAAYLELGAAMGCCDNRGRGGSDDNDESTKMSGVEHDEIDGSTSDTE